MHDYRIHPDIRLAETLPGRFYHDARAYERLRETAFARTWHWVGVENALPQPKYAFPFTLLPGCLEEPLLLVRDASSHIRCLSNVCTHRGNLLHAGHGPCSTLRCRYHGRRFALDGTMEYMPGFEGVQDFPGPSDHLRQLELGRLGKFLFTSLDPACPFEEWMSGLSERIGWLPLNDLQLDSSRTRNYRFPAHWALYVDNYLEGFHIPFVHKALNAGLEIDAYETVLLPWGNVQIGIAREGEPTFDLPPDSPDYGKRVTAYYFWLFPNLMLNFYTWGLSINIVRPQGLTQTEVGYLTYQFGSPLAQPPGYDIHTVEMEDEEVVLTVQKGTSARLYDRGRYSPRWEAGVHQFHQKMVKTMENGQ